MSSKRWSVRTLDEFERKVDELFDIRRDIIRIMAEMPNSYDPLGRTNREIQEDRVQAWVDAHWIIKFCVEAEK